MNIRQLRAGAPSWSLLAVLACNAQGADIGGLTSGTTESSSTTTPASTGDASSSAAAEITSSPSPGETHGETHEPPRPDAGMPPLLDVGSIDPGFQCASDIGDYMFLLDLDGGLHRFSPESLEIESLGPPDCEHGGAAAMALTVDREGLLWAMMAPAGVRAIYTIDPNTLDCALTDFVDPLAENISVNSLAFVADAPGSETESLYIGANVGGSFDFDLPLSLGRVDLDTMAMEIVGTADMVPTGYYQIADLTGTGDSRLFGFFPGDTAAIAELDDSDSSLVSSQLLDFGVGSPWAFAQWAGRLWLFSSGGDPGSDIRAWSPGTGEIEDIHPGIGVSVVGAAVSTCAPYQPEG